jgi:quercetin dioxygenase-like cupin family protein
MTRLMKTNRLGQQLRDYSLLPGHDRNAGAAAVSTEMDFAEVVTVSRGEKSMKFFWLAGFFASIVSQAQAQERKDVSITPLLSSTVTSSGQPIVFPRKNAQIVVSIYDLVPGVVLPVHNHPYPMYAYVLSGSLRVTNMETGRSNTYKPGDFILESVGQWHTGANIGGELLKLLVISIVEKGQSNTVLQRQSLPRPKRTEESPKAPPG